VALSKHILYVAAFYSERQRQYISAALIITLCVIGALICYRPLYHIRQLRHQLQVPITTVTQPPRIRKKRSNVHAAMVKQLDSLGTILLSSKREPAGAWLFVIHATYRQLLAILSYVDTLDDVYLSQCSIERRGNGLLTIKLILEPLSTGTTP